MHLRSGATLGDFMINTFSRHARQEALVGEGQRLTYKDLADRTARLVSVFQSLGLGQGNSLALLAGNRIDVLIAYAAAYIEGIRITPMAALASEDDHAFILEDAEIDALLVDNKQLAERGQALKQRVAGLQQLLSLGPLAGAFDICQAIDAAEAAPLRAKGNADDIAIVGYTGGTTGRPKGVVHTHASFLAAIYFMAAEWEWPKELRVLLTTPVSHAAGTLVPPVHLLGGCIHIAPGFDPEAFFLCVQSERITFTFMVPTMIYRLLDHSKVREFDLSSMAVILYGAAPITAPRLAEGLEVFGPVFQQLYGQSEAPNCISVLSRSNHHSNNNERLLSCGLPIAGVRVALLGEDDQPVADGELGEICVRGPHVMQAYWKRPQETEQVFSGDWLHTGDIGRFDEDGFLYIVDRKKDMIISGGFNVFPREVEDVLSAHPDVVGCAVVGIPDSKWGEAVSAAVVLREGVEPDAASLIDLVREKKGKVYAPKKIYFIEALPLTLLGKPDKKALRLQLVTDV